MTTSGDVLVDADTRQANGRDWCTQTTYTFHQPVVGDFFILTLTLPPGERTTDIDMQNMDHHRVQVEYRVQLKQMG